MSAAAAHPAVDVLTERATVVMQDRPVVPLSAWLASAAVAAGAAGREFQLVAGSDCRLTFPLRTLLGGQGSRWVVPDDSVGYYDGLSGRPLFWAGAAFAPAGPGAMTPAPGFALELGGAAGGLAPLAAVPGRQLLLTVRLRHASTAATRLGRAAELLFGALTGAPPAGWGTAEPATEPWAGGLLTTLARRRAPKPSWFVVVGDPGGRHPALATLLAERAATGVDEVITMAVGYEAAGQLDVGRLAPLAGELAGAGRLVSLLAQVRPGRADLTFAPRWEGLLVPAGLAVGGPAAVELAAGLPGAGAVGPAGRPAAWFPLSDGSSPAGWLALGQVVERLAGGPGPSGPGGLAGWA